jgi:ERO1-like protein beta
MGPIETTTCDFETVESVNDDLYDHLHNLVQMPFFKTFRVRAAFASGLRTSVLMDDVWQVDLYRECPFWTEKVFCANQECSITTVNEVRSPPPSEEVLG